jgi:hypothetical protein
MENSAQILAPFWDIVLSMQPDELIAKASVATHFSKISGTFLMKKPEEVRCPGGRCCFSAHDEF